MGQVFQAFSINRQMTTNSKQILMTLFLDIYTGGVVYFNVWRNLHKYHSKYCEYLATSYLSLSRFYHKMQNLTLKQNYQKTCFTSSSTNALESFSYHFVLFLMHYFRPLFLWICLLNKMQLLLRSSPNNYRELQQLVSHVFV